MNDKLTAMTDPLKRMNVFKEVCEAVRSRQLPVQVSGCMTSQSCDFIYTVSRDLGDRVKRRLIICSDEIKARETADDMKFFDRNTYFYPPRDIIFYNANIHGNAISTERLKVIKAILENEPCTIVTTMTAGLEAVQKPEKFESRVLDLTSGEEKDPGEVTKALVEMGYTRQSQVQSPGEFAVHGGITDIFPPSSPCPVRIEFWDNLVDTIREFDVQSQRSVNELESVKIYSASEIILSDSELQDGLAAIEKDAARQETSLKKAGKIAECNRLADNVDELKEMTAYTRASTGLEGLITYFDKSTCSFFDYFGDETIVFVNDAARCEENARGAADEFTENMVSRIEKGYALKKQVKALLDPAQVQRSLYTDKNTIILSMLDTMTTFADVKSRLNVNVQSVPNYNHHVDLLTDDIKKWIKRKFKVLILSSSHTRAQRIAENLNEYEISAFYRENPDTAMKPGEVMTSWGSLKKGFVYPSVKFVVISENDIYGAKVRRRREKKKAREGVDIQSLNMLSVGDYCIHEDHGIGIYEGIESIKNGRKEKDYIKIKYADGGIIYVPVANLDRLQKYAGKDADKKPKLNKLNSVDWNRTKSKVRKSVKNIARDLVQIYFARQQEKGYAFSPDTVWQSEFEETFPYDETDDQLNAIEDVKRDMESTRIMDRLICGDVGYGKTEIAVRAAFKCVMDGKQAALLVPTTILAQQHYNTFRDRIGEFPVKVAMLSRFVSPSDQKKVIKKLEKGEIDIVIGTHRLLSKDVKFKDLGLLIIDEEQRFGVTHKEKIKEMRKNVDVLALSATPIPRTLHMSLTGIRDMSVLEEPPVDRMPVQTYVMEYDEETVAEAVSREVARGGQVYYVYNRVETIAQTAARLTELLPDVNIAYAHGRMNERQMERIMSSFISGEIDMLISTTIIETGIDIPNVNTIIIDGADRMGLSQLYQLRGRVGRSNRIAYAFLMYRKNKLLSETAEKRLNAIKEFTDLGSGIKVAMRDLEIRGAGNVLGAEQSGHMGEVGYDLYCKMLNQAVKELKQEKGAAISDEESDIYDFDTVIDIEEDAYIPSAYIKSEYEKLNVYKRISSIKTHEDAVEMQEELTDRFGDIPAPALSLIDVALMKAVAHRAFINKIFQKSDVVKIFIQDKNRLDTGRLQEIIIKYRGRLKYVEKGKSSPAYLRYTLKDHKKKMKEMMELLKSLADAVSDK